MLKQAKKQHLYLFFIFLLVLQIKVSAQEDMNFTAFAIHPKSVPDSLYQKLARETDNAKKVKLLWEIGQIYLQEGNTDSIVYYGNEMLNLVENDLSSEESYIFSSKAYWLIGNGKLKNGLYEDALEAFINGLKKIGHTKDDYKDWLELGLAKAYYNLGKLGEAQILFDKFLDNKNTEIKATANYYTAILVLQNNDYEQGESLLRKTITIAKNDSHNRIQFAAQIQLGSLLAYNDKNDKAFEQFKEVLDNSLALKYYDLYTQAAMRTGQLFTKLKDYHKAEMVLGMAYTNSINWNNLNLQKQIIDSLRKTYQAKGDYENAYNLMTQYAAVSEEIIQSQNTKQIQELEVRYRTLQKENQIFVLQKDQLKKEAELTRQKTIKTSFLIGFLVVLVPIIALLFLYYQKLQAQSKINQQEKKLNKQNIKMLQAEQELELAKAGLNAQTDERSRIAKQLHDGIGGNLAGIKLQLSNLDETTALNKEIISQVDQTYELVREISHDLTPKMFSTNNFSYLLEHYSKKINSSGKIDFALFIHPKKLIDEIADKLKVEVYQIIQELSTNALKHAKAKHLELHINIHNGILQLLFEDDGVGFDTSTSKEGIGLKNIQQRLQQLNATVILDSAINRGTAVTIEIPLNR